VFFDNLQVRQDRGRIIEENHYHAHGLKIAAISSKAFGAPNNNYGYQGDFSEMDDDLGWNDFELRSYDPQIGRFLQNDPYDQFASGYVGMGNDPVNNIDPSGGWAATGLFAGAGGVGKIGAATNAAAGFGNIASGVGRVLSIAVNAISLTSQGISLGQNIRGHNQNERQSETPTANGSGDEDWKPLYKKDLQTYVGSTDDNILGTAFEELFKEFSRNDLLMRASNVRPNGKEKFTGGFRNTAPDFVGDAFSEETKGRIRTEITIKGADWYELKQKSGGLYLSSNEDQIAGHIDNLRNSTDLAYRKYKGYHSKLYIVTTADVKYSIDIYERVIKNNVLYEHIHAEYRIVNNNWQFRFKKTVLPKQK